jgi:hypothetical protein
MDFKNITCDGVDWFHMVWDKVQWQAVMNLQI